MPATSSAPSHSHCLEALYLHVPGMLLAVPSTPADAKGLLKAAIRDENPVVFIEHESLYGLKGEVSEEHGIEAEVIDPRTLRPLDLDTILAPVRKTNRCVIVETVLSLVGVA